MWCSSRVNLVRTASITNKVSAKASKKRGSKKRLAESLKAKEIKYQSPGSRPSFSKTQALSRSTLTTASTERRNEDRIAAIIAASANIRKAKQSRTITSGKMASPPMSFEDKIAQTLRGSMASTSTSTPPPAMSFEDKIALALQGSNWQQLQNPNNSSATAQPELFQNNVNSYTIATEPGFFNQSTAGLEDLLAASAEEEASKPPELTAKQKRKKQQFERSVARDAGDELQSIEPNAVQPVAERVTWDEDPELLCSYNWQETTDDTNTIFGEYNLLICLNWRAISYS